MICYFLQYTQTLQGCQKPNMTFTAQGSRSRSVSQSQTRRKQKKRGGKRRSGCACGSHRCKMRKADRLYERYFTICSWNCASANRQGAVLEKTVYNFDAVCLQETRTCPNQPQDDADLALVSQRLAPWTGTESHASHGSDHLAMVFSLQKPGIAPRWKPKYPFKHDKSDTGVMSKLPARKPAHTRNLPQKAVIQPRTLVEQGNPSSVN